MFRPIPSPHTRPQRRAQLGLSLRAVLLLLVVAGVFWAYTQDQKQEAAPSAGVEAKAPATLLAPAPAVEVVQVEAGQVAFADLPAHGQVVYGQILRGGPFAFEKDGTVFGNFERLLPKEPRGYYREYTVAASAKSRSRGAKRIVCGGEPPQRPVACYYTADHYNSFRQIVAVPNGL